MSKPHTGIELLAPAGDLVSFYAAIHNGADAVYLGAGSFGARSSVGFDDESLLTAIRYAHLYGKKVYITLNTLIKQTELTQAKEVLRFTESANADAVIVQDLGLMRLIRRNHPSMPIHASTQMSIHNLSGARFLMMQGVSRVVLARECCLNTISEIAESGIETEVFVHGAQCVSISGQCLMSSHIGGRSGNRGRCAQPCRMEYKYRGKPGAWLSPRDLAQFDRLPDLIEAGISSLKIEGRLKRPEYVAIVTSIYRRLLDSHALGRKDISSSDDRKALLQIFNRGGFTQGWAFGKTDANIINSERVSHEGLALGIIRSTGRRGGVVLSEIDLNDTLRHEDHLQIRGDKDQEMIYSGPEIKPGSRAVIRHHQETKPGDRIYKLTDSLQIEEAQKSYSSPMLPIPLAAKLWIKQGVPAVLTLSSERASVSVAGEIPQPALSMAMDCNSSFRSIQKTGGSPFYIESYEFEADGDCFMTLSSLNALRRDALKRMEEVHIKAYKTKKALPVVSSPKKQTAYNRSGEESALYVRSERIDLIEQFRTMGMNHFLYSPQDYTSGLLPSKCDHLGVNDYLCLPNQATEATLTSLFHLVKDKHLSVMADNVGQLAMDFPENILAGPGIPAWNIHSLNLLSDMGCCATILSTELSKQEICALENPAIQTILPVYGRARVMQLNHCPERTFRGLSGSQKACQLCRAGQGTQGQYLTDRMEARFPLFPTRLPEGCLNTLLFHTPIHLFNNAVGRHWLLDFTLESEETMLSLVSSYADLLKNVASLPPAFIPLYAGRFDEGVL